MFPHRNSEEYSKISIIRLINALQKGEKALEKNQSCLLVSTSGSKENLSLLDYGGNVVGWMDEDGKDLTLLGVAALSVSTDVQTIVEDCNEVTGDTGTEFVQFLGGYLGISIQLLEEVWYWLVVNDLQYSGYKDYESFRADCIAKKNIQPQQLAAMLKKQLYFYGTEQCDVYTFDDLLKIAQATSPTEEDETHANHFEVCKSCWELAQLIERLIVKSNAQFRR